MNDLQFRWLFALVSLTALFISCCLLSGAVRCVRRIERDAILFRLFAERDRLYLLIADEHLSSESPWFTILRDIINAIIRESDDIGIHAYFELSEKLFGNDGQSPMSEEELADLRKMAPIARRELRDAYVATTQTIVDLLAFNSRITRFVRWAEQNSDVLALGKKIERKSSMNVKRFDEIIAAGA